VPTGPPLTSSPISVWPHSRCPPPSHLSTPFACSSACRSRHSPARSSVPSVPSTCSSKPSFRLLNFVHLVCLFIKAIRLLVHACLEVCAVFSVTPLPASFVRTCPETTRTYRLPRLLPAHRRYLPLNTTRSLTSSSHPHLLLIRDDLLYVRYASLMRPQCTRSSALSIYLSICIHLSYVHPLPTHASVLPVAFARLSARISSSASMRLPSTRVLHPPILYRSIRVALPSYRHPDVLYDCK
jgi:hypothetical protein